VNLPLPQVSQIFRAITPDEYDAAVQRCPTSCPLYMCGDRRSGRQLLEDGERDFHTPLSGYAPHVFDSVVHCLTEACARLRLDNHAAAATASPTTIPSPPPAWAVQCAPLPTHPALPPSHPTMAVTSRGPLVRAAPLPPGPGPVPWARLARERWPATPLRAYWTFGFRPEVSAARPPSVDLTSV
jgi:hypothetical protein